MKVVLQRVRTRSVSVDGAQVASIGRGYLLLVGIGSQDADDEVERMAEKVGNLRLFADADGKTNLALADVGGEILVVSQFTLYADVRKGRRPSWTSAASPDVASARRGVRGRSGAPRVPRGTRRLRADMDVDLLNDGPFTLVLDAGAL